MERLRRQRRGLALWLALLAFHALVLPLHVHDHEEAASLPACVCDAGDQAALHGEHAEPLDAHLCTASHSGALPAPADPPSLGGDFLRPAPVAGASLTGRPPPAARSRGPPPAFV